MRFSRGVVKIPIKCLYVFLIVISTAFFLYLHILKDQRIRSQGQCRVIPGGYKPPTSKKVHDRSQQNHTVCMREPEFTNFEDCPHCFRPNVQNLSSKFYQVQYSMSIFPRGPPNFFKPRNEIQQELVADYLITPSSVCVDACPYLVAIVLSISDDVEQRNAVRATWASAAKTRLWPHAQLNADMQVIFLLAHKTEWSRLRNGENHTPRNNTVKEQYPTIREWTRIKTEADRYGDILYLNMQDSYYNLTQKIMSGFKWVGDHCSKTKFFLKVDIDTFVNVPLLLDLLIVAEERLEYSILGRVYTRDRVVRREHKWAVDSQIYPIPTFPVYASGCAYIISARLLSRMTETFPYMAMAEAAQQIQGNQTSFEDLFVTGILGLVLGCDYFTEAANIWTHSQDKDWFWCDIIYDRKVVGKIFEENGLYKMWRSFFRYYGKCWKEIPELANP